jgi:hypothetical protein
MVNLAWRVRGAGYGHGRARNLLGHFHLIQEIVSPERVMQQMVRRSIVGVGLAALDTRMTGKFSAYAPPIASNAEIEPTLKVIAAAAVPFARAYPSAFNPQFNSVEQQLSKSQCSTPHRVASH